MSYSSAPRRPSHLGPASAIQRPGFSPRSSSLSINSNDSTTSLLASSRRPNGSGWKKSATVSEAPDPLALLEKLLGSEVVEVVQETTLTNAAGKIDPDEVERELDFEGLDLRQLISPSATPNQEDLYTTQTREQCMLYP